MGWWGGALRDFGSGGPFHVHHCDTATTLPIMRIRFLRETQLGIVTADSYDPIVYAPGDEAEFGDDHAVIFIMSGAAELVPDAEQPEPADDAPASGDAVDETPAEDAEPDAVPEIPDAEEPAPEPVSDPPAPKTRRRKTTTS